MSGKDINLRQDKDNAAPRFAHVKTERMDDGTAGVLYGGHPRILMRSPTHILYVALGVHIVPRRSRGFHDIVSVAKRAVRKELSAPHARDVIIRFFGAGADDEAITAVATHGKGTVLVDGGGDVLVRAKDRHAALETAYAAVAPDTDNLITVSKTCRQCGNPLEPVVDHHHFGNSPEDDQPRTFDECQRLSNTPIMKIRGYGSNKPQKWWPYVSGFTTWDGVTYRDRFFCKDACAAKYGRRAASQLPPLEVGGEPEKAGGGGDHISHHEEKPFIWPSGLRA